jgi:adenosylhomocysteine nucleosidase
MRPELRPLVRKLSLRRDDARAGSPYSGRIGDVEVVATTTGIGTRAATEATERLLDAMDVDHLMVVGIAGGIGPTVAIGDLVVPELVVDRSTGSEYRPEPLGATPRGTIVTSDEFGYAPDQLGRFIDDGVVAVDMETASIGAVCVRRGCPWSAFRAISDRADDDTVDPEVLELAGPDGSGNMRAVARYLLRRPWRIVRLARLAQGSKLATEAAADAAVRACAAFHSE